MDQTDFIKNLDWVKFDAPRGEALYYFPDSMALIEYNDGFGRLLAELKDGHGRPAVDQPEGFRDEVFHNLRVLRERGLLEKLTTPPVPGQIPLRRLILANTMRCNLACSYCYNRFQSNAGASGSSDRGDMTPDTLARATAFLERHGPGLPYYELFFIGGEPLVHRDILDEAWKWGERLRQQGRNLHIAVTTNATLLTREVLEFCEKRTINLKLTLDGDAEEHDRHRLRPDGQGSYSQIMANLPGYFHACSNPYKYVATTIDTLTSDLEARVLRLAAMGFNIIDLTELYAADVATDSNRDEQELERLFKAKYRKVLDFLWLRTRSRNYLHVIPIFEIVKNVHKRTPAYIRCRAGGNSLAVAPDGTLYTCHHFFGDERFALGNVHDDSLPDEALAPYRVSVEGRKPCSTCWARLLCGGPCFHRSLAVTGSPFECYALDCTRRRALIQEVLKFYLRLRNEDPASLEWFVQSGTNR